MPYCRARSSSRPERSRSTPNRSPCGPGWCRWVAGVAGFYGNDLLDNLARPSATMIVADLQHLEVGQWIPMSPSSTPTEKTAFRVDSFEVASWMLSSRSARQSRSLEAARGGAHRRPLPRARQRRTRAVSPRPPTSAARAASATFGRTSFRPPVRRSVNRSSLRLLSDGPAVLGTFGPARGCVRSLR